MAAVKSRSAGFLWVCIARRATCSTGRRGEASAGSVLSARAVVDYDYEGVLCNAKAFYLIDNQGR